MASAGAGMFGDSKTSGQLCEVSVRSLAANKRKPDPLHCGPGQFGILEENMGLHLPEMR
jgi:hypothetical protein